MITILTPTYNRSHTLTSLYQSLVQQTQYSFEWLIIDDGSIDDTEIVINNYSQESPFAIRYIKKENGGKHSALNLGFKESYGEWIFIVDSDDTLSGNTIEFLQKEIVELSEDFNSISTLRVYPNNKIIGQEFPSNLVTYLDRIHMGVKGDKADVIRKSALKDFQFPEFSNENFMAESPLFIWLGNRGNTKFINFKGYICEYLPGGLTNNSTLNRHKCVNSTLYVYNYQYENLHSKKLKIKAAVNWWRFRLFKNPYYNIRYNIPILYLPFGLVLYINDVLKRRT